MVSPLSSLGDDEIPSVLWPLYCVADIPLMNMRPVDDPEYTGKKALVEQVYVVREPEWDSYPIPEHIQDIIERQGREPKGKH